MTEARDVLRLVVGEPREAIMALRRRGLRVSTPRRLIIEALFAADGPVSAQRLARELSLEESSVYRNLEVLERHGLTWHVHLGHGPGLYALAGRDDGEYLYCERCGKVTVLAAEDMNPLRERLEREFGHHASFTHFAIVGLCSTCVKHSGEGAENMADPRQEHDHQHEHPHSHPHEHADGTVHQHTHSAHEHEHVEHEHKHSHGEYVHSHAHVHQEGLEDRHEHEHEP